MLPTPFARAPAGDATPDMRVDRRKDPRRRAAVDVAIALAELNASWADYERALEHLRAADELAGGALADRFTSERDEWAARLQGTAAIT
jgi:hypothetical protein